MPKAKSESLEDLLKKFEGLHAEESVKERADLATRIDLAITKSINEFLIDKHGKDEQGVPLHYHLGDAKKDYKGAYQEADELIHQIGLATLPYLFPKASKQRLNVLKELFEEEPYNLLGLLRAHGFDTDRFKQELMNNKQNIFNSEDVKTIIAQTALGVAGKEVAELGHKIFHEEHQDDLVKYAKNRFAKEGYEITAESLKPQEMMRHLSALYINPDLGSAYLRTHKKYIKKTR